MKQNLRNLPKVNLRKKADPGVQNTEKVQIEGVLLVLIEITPLVGNVDILQEENKNILQRENQDILQVENEDLLLLESHDILLTETKDTHLVGNKEFCRVGRDKILHQKNIDGLTVESVANVERKNITDINIFIVVFVYYFEKYKTFFEKLIIFLLNLELS